MAVTVYKDDLTVGPSGKHETRELTIACVGAASGGAIANTDLCAISGLKAKLQGWGLWAVETIPGTPGPTDDSDVYLKTADATDMLAGNGVDQLDNAVNRFIYPPVSPMPIGPTLTLDVDGQSVNSAAYKIKLYLAR